jgi:transcriptional regulator with XRE-family HTH domain
MTQEGWQERLTRVMAGQIRRYRDARGLSGQQLSERCAALGAPIHRSVIANLENGRRPNVSITELLVLAAALDVPPLLLVLPVGRQDDVEILPGQEVTTAQAVMWLSGQGDLHLTPAGADVLWNDAGLVPLVIEHERLVDDLQEDRKAIGQSATDEDIKLWQGMKRRIQETRSHLRQLGLTPPPLPPELAYLDDQESASDRARRRTGGNRRGPSAAHS